MLGTGSGDVLALDVDAGHLSWRITDCHPGLDITFFFLSFYKLRYNSLGVLNIRLKLKSRLGNRLLRLTLTVRIMKVTL